MVVMVVSAMKKFAKWPCGRGHRGGDVKLAAARVVEDKIR